MKTLTINSLGWIKAFFMAAGPLAKSRPSVYRSSSINDTQEPLEPENSRQEEPTKVALGDIMRTAHRGNFSAGPTFLFHPGWFK